MTWHARDCSGNTSEQIHQTITVTDTTPPMIGGQGPDATIQCPATPTFIAPMAVDTCGGAMVVNDGDTTAAGTCANNYSKTRTWHAMDACGNTSGQVHQTITVQDNTPPVIGLAGPNSTIACNGTPMFTPPTASDACGTSSVQQVSDSTTTQGTNTIYTRCWNAVDACSNTSATVCQTITSPACASPTPTPTGTPSCQVSTTIASNFNGTAISAGRYIWFTSVLKAKNLPANQIVTLHFTNQSITSSAFNLSPGDATVIIDPNATTATTTWSGNMPTTTVPASGLAGNTFFSAFSYLVPANIPGGLNPVTWSGTMTSDKPGVTVNWQWAAAVYTSFSSNYTALGVKPTDDNDASIYHNSDHAGTPENYKMNVTGGARGGGGSNYTGSYSGTGGITCPR
jgi:hypothetical protein